jgi:hypothetical protein
MIDFPALCTHVTVLVKDRVVKISYEHTETH